MRITKATVLTAYSLADCSVKIPRFGQVPISRVTGHVVLSQFHLSRFGVNQAQGASARVTFASERSNNGLGSSKQGNV